MSGNSNNPGILFYGRKLYLLLSLIAAVPVYLAINAYAMAIHAHENEAISAASTIYFIAMIFSGRYLVHVWFARRRMNFPFVLIVFAVVVVACLVWLFYHGDHQLETRRAFNLLLFWWPFSLMSISIGIMLSVAHIIVQAPLRHARSAEAKSKMELHMLQSQLSPHFLFNTLNNLYGLSITRYEKVPPLLLKLSELLRYSVYEAKEIYVPLMDEMAYINNYIEFEKIRMDDRLDLDTDFEKITDQNIKIAPMLLIVFIENAFKHSKNTVEKKVSIFISLKTWNNHILFTVQNSHDNTQPNSMNEKHSGLGMPNVYKRLELLYQGEHELNILDENNTYSVNLQLKMK